MAGSWELPRHEVLVAILTRELVTMAWAQSHRMMQIPPGSNVVYLSGMPFDHARNSAVEAMLAEGYEYLFFVDDDVIIPPNAYAILKSNNLPIVSGLYYRRNLPLAPVAIVRLPNGQPSWLPQWKLGEIIPVDYVGAGCLLIQRRVFEIMPPPWFEWTCDRGDLPPGTRLSEDFEFCRKLKMKHGIIPHVDTRVQCLHCGLSRVAVDGSILPLTAGSGA